MRKLTVLLLSVMVIMALFVSCTVEVNEDTGETVTLRFTTDEAEGMRSLSASKQTFDATLYKWYYTAEKCDKDADKPSPASGSKSSETLVGTEGSLSDSVGPFSLGKWNFTIKGYTKEDSPQLAWEGSAKNVEINTSTSSVPITVEPVKTLTGTGTIFIANNITLTANGKTYTANYSKVTSVLSDCYSDTTDVAIDKDKGRTVNDSTLLSGVYKVEVSYKASEGNDVNTTDYTYATNYIYVNVWNGLKTTIGGTLDESKKYATFEATDSSGSDAKVSVVNTTTGASYTDLQTAIDKASSGNTIKVTENVVVSDTITASKDITLVVEEGKTVKKYDVDGNTITLFTEGTYKFVSSTAPSDVAVGDTLVMGSIPSSDTKYGGMNVTWKVLAVNDGAASVISEKVLLNLEHQKSEDNDYSWVNSLINTYLNQSDEKGFISQYGLSGISMVDANLKKVFLFNKNELKQYYKDETARIAYGLDGSTASAWWLRDEGDTGETKKACYVKSNGDYGESSEITQLGVRPGFFINIAKSN